MRPACCSFECMHAQVKGTAEVAAPMMEPPPGLPPGRSCGSRSGGAGGGPPEEEEDDEARKKREKMQANRSTVDVPEEESMGGGISCFCTACI